MPSASSFISTLIEGHMRTVDPLTPTISLITGRRGSDGVYGDYLGEILAAEGVAFSAIDLAGPSGTAQLRSLDPSHVIVVAQATLARDEARSIADAVRAGAALVVVRPSLLLQRELGLRSRNTTVRDGRLVGSDADRTTAFLAGEKIQVPTPSEIYAIDALPADVDVHATIGTDDRGGSWHPAVLSFPVGSGRATVISYDLAHAVAMLRHGDPALAGLRSIGADDPYRPTDLLAHIVDPLRWHLPQADMHNALLVNALLLARGDPHEGARTWYFDGADVSTVIVQDSDDDWSTREEFTELVESAERHGMHVTFYLMAGTRPTVLDAATVHDLVARGHSFGIHHNAFDESFEGEEQAVVLDQVIAADMAWFREEYGLDAVANRNHCLVWNGYADLPRTFAAHGVVMEFNAENSAGAWLKYLAGSGRPLRHVDERGELIDVYQQATLVFDDSLVEERLSTDVADEVAQFRETLLAHRDRFFIPLTLQSHPLSFAAYSRAFFEGCWTVATDLGVPTMSATEWARETQRRRATTVVSHSEGRDLVVEISAEVGASLVTVAVPLPGGGRWLPPDGGTVTQACERDVFGIRHLLIDVRLSADGRARVRLMNGGNDD